ncbi:clavesin-2-like [Vespa velutina]|uniref:clavesin-2-like n=1 Tax=Vespa velutina TaxID=202808 RepID=UPI001FB27043|nr:clavesin-2-like [Vespa velutina]XP_047350649.1 clavesin-2-like [Vespa velutina]XP_047350650.1 clavesin-2-like [Vespa velutina]
MGMDEQQEFSYECGLSKDTQKMAKDELREDDKMREQSLEQFRQWILKHPSIKTCRMDPIFLLRFLRTKKFSLPMAQKMLERYLTVRQLYPEWFQNLDIDDPEIEAIIDNGYIIPLLERDAQGRKILFISPERFNPYKYTLAQMVRVHSIIFEALLDDEENQVRGYNYIIDESGLTMGHLSVWSFTDIRNMLYCAENSLPVRHKETHFINIPTYASKIIEFAMSCLKDKFRNRIVIHKSIEELKEILDPKILPKEYGGEVPLTEMIDTIKKILKEKKEQIKALDKMHIEISPNEYQGAYDDEFSGIFGSFRKLEVD